MEISGLFPRLVSVMQVADRANHSLSMPLAHPAPFSRLLIDYPGVESPREL